jgi:hypothetical protein
MLSTPELVLDANNGNRSTSHAENSGDPVVSTDDQLLKELCRRCNGLGAATHKRGPRKVRTVLAVWNDNSKHGFALVTQNL